MVWCMKNKPGSSAALIAFGFVSTAVGSVLNVIGAGMNAAEVVSKYGAAEHPGTGWVVFGLIFAGAGVVGLAAGFYKLAASVDYLVALAPGTARPVKTRPAADETAAPPFNAG